MSTASAGYKQGMLGSESRLLLVVAGLLSLSVVSAPAVGQQADSAQGGVAKVREAAEKWLATDQTSEELMADTVGVVLADPPVGLAWLGEQMAAAGAASNTRRGKGLNSLSVQAALEFLRRTHKSGMTFVGQYDPLRGLDRFAADLLFKLLVDTPEWYPLTFRVRLVPALRDVQLRSPTIGRLDSIIAIVEDDRETTALRNGLAAALWQWGKPEYAKRVLKRLIAETAEGDGEDRVGATLVLADYYNVLRDYKSAARTHRAARALAKGSGVELPPIAFYSAACVQALSGDVDAGMESLEICARMHASPNLDRSLRLKRSLFEKDPEIASLRENERFAALLKLAFGDTKTPKESRGGR